MSDLDIVIEAHRNVLKNSVALSAKEKWSLVEVVTEMERLRDEREAAEEQLRKDCNDALNVGAGYGNS